MPTGIYIRTEEIRKKISLGKMGKNRNPEDIKKMVITRKENGSYVSWNKGKKLPCPSIETRKKMSESKTGSQNRNWRGGITLINAKMRNSLEMKLWREAVFKRDNWTCQQCKNRGIKLHAHHIKSFALFPELRFAIDNGLALCIPCHKNTDTYLNKKISW